MGIILKLALRTLARRKGRMALIGILVAFGTFLIVFGMVFAASAAAASKAAIIDNFTGDFILYSDRSKDPPSPFAFAAPLPRIRDPKAVEAALAALPEVEAWAPYAQNYGIIQTDRDGDMVDLPFIFYAVEPEKYRAVFGSPPVQNGGFFQAPLESGILISEFQNRQYKENYGIELASGREITLLGITEGGVNTTRSRVAGIFEPRRYTSVFNYINFMDAESYAELYNFTGVEALPESFDRGLSAAGDDEDAIFALADDPGFGSIDVADLTAAAASGATMIAVRLKDHESAAATAARITGDPALGIKAATWEEASGFYAQINVTERTAEIGTMSAIGAEASFIRGMFLAETLILNVSSSLVGMLAAGIALAVFGNGGITLPEIVSQFLVGGGPIPLRPSAGPFALGLLVVVAVSILATIYPVRVATSITPLRAMSDR